MNLKLTFCEISIMLLTLGTMNSFSQDSKFIPEHSAIISSTKGDEMLKQCSRSVPGKVKSYFDLTIEHVQGLENNFLNILDIKADGCCLLGGKIITLNNYCFQYVGLVINNKKYIYINAFQSESEQDLNTFFKDWKTTPIIACDGGESFWGVLYEIETGLFTQLSINGVA